MDDLINLSTDKNKQAEDRAKRKKDREDNDLRAVLDMAEGRRVVWRIMAFCGAFKENLHTDTNLTFIEKGLRSVGLWLLSLILDVKPNAFHQMQREAKSLAKQEEQDNG